MRLLVVICFFIRLLLDLLFHVELMYRCGRFWPLTIKWTSFSRTCYVSTNKLNIIIGYFILLLKNMSESHKSPRGRKLIIFLQPFRFKTSDESYINGTTIFIRLIRYFYYQNITNTLSILIFLCTDRFYFRNYNRSWNSKTNSRKDTKKRSLSTFLLFCLRVLLYE